ncbi:DUF4846 domain-containing protein [Soonwooa sp.]|uniref:DUF4846 domain-containing protein n=1 Tax=Soonwooa sp. TaxID=1938592 RepID=UPI0028ADA182|nr:DUF4846 domain-containing protein [Soonwooa sp.]
MMKIFKLIILSLVVIACNKQEKIIEKPTLNSPELKTENITLINPKANILKDRLLPISDFKRVETPANSWENFLQNLKLQGFGKPILKYDGSEISDQKHHVGILTYDIGTTDLQQCADALIRLRAEYLFKNEKYSDIHFRFTSGDNYAWESYAKGIRPIINGNSVRFSQSASTNQLNNYQEFRKYLDIIYTYAGTISLARDLKEDRNKKEFEIGDLIITPGSPGHVVMVVDKIDNGDQKRYALIEGYTPAQSIHILSESANPWFDLKISDNVPTPRYYFKNAVIKHF